MWEHAGAGESNVSEEWRACKKKQKVKVELSLSRFWFVCKALCTEQLTSPESTEKNMDRLYFLKPAPSVQRHGTIYLPTSDSNICVHDDYM